MQSKMPAHTLSNFNYIFVCLAHSYHISGFLLAISLLILILLTNLTVAVCFLFFLLLPLLLPSLGRHLKMLADVIYHMDCYIYHSDTVGQSMKGKAFVSKCYCTTQNHKTHIRYTEPIFKTDFPKICAFLFGVMEIFCIHKYLFYMYKYMLQINWELAHGF